MHKIELLKSITFLKNLSPPKERLNKIDFIHHYKNIFTKKTQDNLQQRFVTAFFIRKYEFFKIVNFLKNPSPPKEGLNNIGFMHNYKTVYIKKPLGHL